MINSHFQDFSGSDFAFFIIQDFSGPVGTLDQGKNGTEESLGII